MTRFFTEPDSFFGGEVTRQIYLDVAKNIPTGYVYGPDYVLMNGYVATAVQNLRRSDDGCRCTQRSRRHDPRSNWYAHNFTMGGVCTPSVQTPHYYDEGVTMAEADITDQFQAIPDAFTKTRNL